MVKHELSYKLKTEFTFALRCIAQEHYEKFHFLFIKFFLYILCWGTPLILDVYNLAMSYFTRTALVFAAFHKVKVYDVI